jgi:hypothetical protein
LRTHNLSTMSFRVTVMLDYSIRGSPTSIITPEFYGWTGRGAVVFHGIRARRSRFQAPAMHILLCVIIPTYRSPYSVTRISQTSGPLERSSRPPHPFYIT